MLVALFDKDALVLADIDLNGHSSGRTILAFSILLFKIIIT